MIENTIRIEQGQIRAVTDCLEAKYQRKIPRDHQSIPSLVEHAVQCINRYRIGRDGKSAYQRVKGPQFNVRVAEFGECALRRPRKSPDRIGKLENRVCDGVNNRLSNNRLFNNR